MNRCVLVALAVLASMLPNASGFDHDPSGYPADLPSVSNLRVEAGNQRLHISWEPLGHPNLTGYVVSVYGDDGLVQRANVTQPQWTYAPAVNNVVYLVEVSGLDREGNPGPPALEAAQPRFQDDQTYLALGLIVVWVGMWAYAFLLARRSRELAARWNRIQKEKNRLRDRR